MLIQLSSFLSPMNHLTNFLKKCSINTFFLYTSRQSSLDMAETSTSPCPPLAMKSYSLTESVKHRLSRIISVDDDSTPDDVNSEEPPKSE